MSGPSNAKQKTTQMVGVQKDFKTTKNPLKYIQFAVEIDIVVQIFIDILNVF